MADFVGVANALYYSPSKRDALLFDLIAIVMPRGRVLDPIISAADFAWLQENGIVAEIRGFDVPKPGELIDSTTHSYLRGSMVTAVVSSAFSRLISEPDAFDEVTDYRDVWRTVHRLLNMIGGVDIDAIANAAHHELLVRLPTKDRLDPSRLAATAEGFLFASTEGAARLMTHQLRSRYAVDAVPIMRRTSLTHPATSDGREAPVIEIVLTRLPEPEEDVPWEKVIEFRADPDVQRLRRLLRIWMRKVGAQSPSNIEIAQELDELLDKYEEYMRLHRMKTVHGIIRTVVVATLEALENVVRFKPGAAAKALFTLRDENIRLFEAELNAPGREVAYIARARDRFRRRVGA